MSLHVYASRDSPPSHTLLDQKLDPRVLLNIFWLNPGVILVIFMTFTLTITFPTYQFLSKIFPFQSFVPILTICNFSKVKQYIEGVSDPEQFIATLVQNKSDVLQVK